MSSLSLNQQSYLVEETHISIFYCNASNMEILLKELNIGLEIGNKIRLKIQLDKVVYYGAFNYYGFGIKYIIEEQGRSIVELIKNKTIDNIKIKQYSWLIKLPRTGKMGKRIFVYKLRTMQPYSEYIHDMMIENHGLNDNGTIRYDFRITKMGKILRKYWIDELPMLINLLKGDVKLIGVRPLGDTMLNAYPKDHKDYRSEFKPGLIPPYYIDKPQTFDEIIQSERRYLDKYRERPIFTDLDYFYKFIKMVFIKGVRSS